MTVPSVPARRRWTIGLALLCVAPLAALYAVCIGTIDVPPRYNPWAPLDIAAPPNFLTGYKLGRARGDPALCQAALARTGLQYERLPDHINEAGCGFENAVRLRSAPVRFGAPLPLSCPMALSFAIWEKQALQPAAQRGFGQKVVAVEHLGSYACRDINRGQRGGGKLSDLSGSRSRHATADALDIAAVTLANGKRISVLRDWDSEESRPSGDLSPEARLLRELHRSGCDYFDGALGPDYNAVHRDHFHFETGGYGMCR
jgi:hypothetical protein